MQINERKLHRVATKRGRGVSYRHSDLGSEESESPRWQGTHRLCACAHPICRLSLVPAPHSPSILHLTFNIGPHTAASEDAQDGG